MMWKHSVIKLKLAAVERARDIQLWSPHPAYVSPLHDRVANTNAATQEAVSATHTVLQYQ